MSYVGGHFAPAITDTMLATYAADIASLVPGQVKDVLTSLLTLLQTWKALPASQPNAAPQANPQTHPSGRGLIVSLDETCKAALYELIPWPSELKMYGELLDAITDLTTRNMAFHLLWYATELNLGREPITMDKLDPPADTTLVGT